MSTLPVAAGIGEELELLLSNGAIEAVDARVTEALLRLTGERRPEVARVVALAVAAPRAGDVCLDLAAPRTLATDTGLRLLPADPAALLDALATSPTVAVVEEDAGPRPGDARPLVLRGTRCYLDRLDRAEGRVAAGLGALAAREHDVDRAALDRVLDRLLPAGAPGAAEQRAAVVNAATRGLTVLAGGPGTGKTTTVARLIAAVLVASGQDAAPRIALAAPTGRAAARLTASVVDALDTLDLEPWVAARLRDAPGRTIHRLLGWRNGAPSRFLHGPDRPLPHDLVVVDEASMVPLALFADLLGALAPTARLVLVGDQGQLAAVEAGSVLGDLVANGTPVIAERVTELRHAFRYPSSGAIGATARVLRSADADGAGLARALDAVDATDTTVEVLRPPEGEHDRDVHGLGLPAVVAERVVGAFVEVARLAQDGADAEVLLRAIDRSRLLVPLRIGPDGVEALDLRIAAAVDRLAPDPDARASGRGLALGRPVMVTRNDPAIDLYNGDVGVVVRDPAAPEDPRRRRVAFDGADGVRLVPLARLPGHETVHAMSVHKSQGAQFDDVVLVLPRVDHPLVTRELVYTGATRARRSLTIVASAEVLDAALARSVRRTSGLGARLASA